MLERNRIIKESSNFNDICIDKIYYLNGNQLYNDRIIDVVKKLYLEKPDCFEPQVVYHKLALAEKLAQKNDLDIEDFYHYTYRDNNTITGIRYQKLPLDNISAQEYLESYQYMITLNIVQYEIDGPYGHELIGSVTYNRRTKNLIVHDIGFIEMLDGCYTGYTYNQNYTVTKPFVKKK